METSGNCHVERVSGTHDQRPVHDARSVLLAVAGLGCPTCVNRVYNALMLSDGVLTADVSLQAARVLVTFDAERIDVGRLMAAVEAAGSDSRHQYRAFPVTAATVA